MSSKKNNEIELINENEKLKNEVVELKKKCDEIQNKLNNYSNSMDIFNEALEYLHGGKRYNNVKRSIIRLKKASEKGNRCASFLLGLLHENGEGTTKDIKEAMNFYSKASDQDN